MGKRLEGVKGVVRVGVVGGRVSGAMRFVLNCLVL